MTRVVASIVLAVAVLLADPAPAAEPKYRLAWVWAISGPCCGDSGEDMLVDENGEALVYGHYGKLDLDNDGQLDRTAFGLADPMIFRANASGRLMWLKGSGSTEYDTARGIAAAPGGAYIGGHFSKQGIFPPATMIAARGPSDGFLARVDKDGQTLWAKAIGGVGDDSVMDVASDDEGNAYFVANARGGVDLDGDGKYDVQNKGEASVLVASYTSEGKLRWARMAAAAGKAYAHAAASLPEGGIVIGASHRDGPIDVDGDGKNDLPPAPADDGGHSYIARFEADGRLAWVHPILSTGGAGISAIARFGNGDLAATGAFNGELDIDSDGRHDVALPADASPQLATWVARYAPDGTLRWARKYGGAVRIWHAAARDEHVVISGLYTGALDFDGDGELDGRADPDGKSEGLVVMLDGEGDVLRIMSIVGPAADQARAAGFTPDGKAILVTGFVRLTADFDDDGVPEGGVRCDHRGDVFMARYDLLD